MSSLFKKPPVILSQADVLEQIVDKVASLEKTAVALLKAHPSPDNKIGAETLEKCREGLFSALQSQPDDAPTASSSQNRLPGG